MSKIAILQIDSVLDDIEANLAKVDEMVASIQDNDVKMAVFCEYSLTGYRTDLYCISDLVPGVSSDGLEKIAKKHDMWLSGGTVEKVGDKIANVSLMISSTKGLVAKYRKIHPFGQAERDNIVFGDEPIVVDTDLGKVGMTICYDFLFPELVRGLVLQGAEIILNSTFWFADGPAGFAPEQIISLARTRALENNVYVAMASRKGEEKALWGDKLRGFGYSSIVSHTGQTLAIAGLGEVVVTAPIDLSTRAEWSEYAPHINDRRPELYKKLLDIQLSFIRYRTLEVSYLVFVVKYPFIIYGYFNSKYPEFPV